MENQIHTKSTTSELSQNFEFVNHFNKNFFCHDVDTILSLYRQINNIWQHPLILNYNHCLICKETVNSPYSIYSLQETHLKELPYPFLKSNKIKLRHITISIHKTQRRIIHSQDHQKNDVVSKEFNNQFENGQSDTDILFMPKVIIDKNPKLYHHRQQNHRHSHKKYSKLRKILSAENEKALLEKKKQNRMSRVSIKGIHNINLQTQTEQKYKNTSKFQTFELEDKYKESINNKESYTPHPKQGLTFNSLVKMFKKLTKEEDEANDNTPRHDLKYIPSPKNKPFVHGINSPRNTFNSNDIIHKNEICNICSQEIAEKFILECGDFYCKDCIKEVVLNCINNISLYNKMVCPKAICKKEIDERAVERLLSREEYDKYYKIKTRIDGLKNKILIPCPFPDCEQNGNEKDIQNNLLYCDNNHLFCVKCLLLLNPQDIEKEKEHTCNCKPDENERLCLQNNFIKKCPNCHTWVQRDPGGCNNMTCLNPWCNTEFCWLCEGRYESGHYKNPFAVCFGLQESDYKSKFSRYKSIRVLKCVIIFLLLILIVLPILVNLFSFVIIGLYNVTFVFDGSAFKNIKLKNKWANIIFKTQTYILFVGIAIASIPLGYITLALSVLFIPVLCIVNKCKRMKEEEEELY